MITGAHFLIYSMEPGADRAFFKDVLGFRSVDAGGGWLIFALPPAELAVHPADGGPKKRNARASREMARVDFYLMCDDLHSVIKSLLAKNVKCPEIENARWGMKTTIPLPSGTEIGLYQPTHPTAIGSTKKKGLGSAQKRNKSTSVRRRMSR